MAGTSFISAADLPLADKDTTVDVDMNGATVTRKVFAGQRVPAELVAAWREQTGAPLTEAEIRAREAEDARAAAAAELDADPEGAEQGDPAPARKTARRK
jgi:hypothetical protein